MLHTAMYIESKPSYLFVGDEYQKPCFEFTQSQVKRLIRCDDGYHQEVAAGVRSQFASMNGEWTLYEPDAVINLRDSDIAYTCALLNRVVISDRRRDVFGDALEIFRGQWAKRVSGQFFTDQRVTRLAIALLEFDPRQGDDLIDVCAGTGGFLVAGLNRIRKLLEQDGVTSEQRLIELASRSLKGQEIDPDVCAIANATLAARISKVRHAFVTLGDSLQLHTFGSGNPLGISFDTHSCAATNPPFGTKITIKNTEVLRQFELARNSHTVSSRAPDMLFIEQNLRLVKPGSGRLAITVPYQILSGPQTLFVREWILGHAHILAVIDLPPDTFQPHTGTKACLLVLKRRLQPLQEISRLEQTDIFMAMPRWIGHDRRGNPVYRSASDGRVTDEILSDFEQVEEAYALFRQGGNPADAHELSFRITARQILQDQQLRLNALYYKPGIHAPIVRRGATLPGWRKVYLRDVVKAVFYPTRFKRNYVDYYPGAVPFLGGANISQLVVSTDKWLRHDDPKLSELIVRTGWLLITRSGTTGIISSVPSAWDGFAMSEHVIRIVPDETKLNSAYLYTYLRTKLAQEALERGIFGSVINEITPDFVGQIEVWIPDSEELVARVIHKTQEAQLAREKAIDLLADSLDELNRSLDTE